MPRYKVEMSRTCYYTESATVEVDAIDERHAKQVARNEDVDFESNGDMDCDGIEIQDVEEIEPDEDDTDDEEEEVNA